MSSTFSMLVIIVYTVIIVVIGYSCCNYYSYYSCDHEQWETAGPTATAAPPCAPLQIAQARSGALRRAAKTSCLGSSCTLQDSKHWVWGLGFKALDLGMFGIHGEVDDQFGT